MSALDEMLDGCIIASAALEAATRGWPVLPLHHPLAAGGCSCRNQECTNIGKHPRTTHGLDDASTDHTVITRWWERWPNANLGLRTGIAFDVLDIDHDDPQAATADWPAFDMPGGPVARTGKGWHFLLQPTGKGNRARITGSPCDWRGAGGYIVAPPSVHASGRRYEWYTTPDAGLQPAPAELLELLEPPKRTTAPTPPKPPRPGTFTRGTWTVDPLVATVSRAADGTRNNVLNWAAVAVGFAVYNRRTTAAGGEHAQQALADAARALGLGEHEIQATIRSGFAAGTAGRDPSTPKTHRGAA